MSASPRFGKKHKWLSGIILLIYSFWIGIWISKLCFFGSSEWSQRKALGLFNRFHASGAESTDCVSILICFQLLYFYSCISLKIVPQLKRDLIKSYFVNANFTLSCFNSRYSTKGKASKAFLTKDKSGATFLCYLLGQLEKLR